MFKFDMAGSFLVSLLSYFLGLCVMLYIRKRYKSTLNDDDEFVLYYLLFTIGGILMILRSILPS